MALNYTSCVLGAMCLLVTKEVSKGVEVERVRDDHNFTDDVATWDGEVRGNEQVFERNRTSRIS